MLSQETKDEIISGFKKWMTPAQREAVLADIPAFIEHLSTPSVADSFHPRGEFYRDDVAANKTEAGRFIAGILGQN